MTIARHIDNAIKHKAQGNVAAYEKQISALTRMYGAARINAAIAKQTKESNQ